MIILESLVSAKTVAKMCGGGITSRTIIRWAKLKRIPCVRINKRVVRFDIEEVRNWLEKKK